MDFTDDAFFNGRVTVFQPKKGFRAGTDSVLLAAALEADAKGEALEMGAGSGAALLMAAHRLPEMSFKAVETDPAMATLARKGVSENGFADRVEVLDRDVDSLPRSWENRFDLVFSNPPFFEYGTIQSPGEGKSTAYLESISLQDWLGGMLFTLRHKGTLVVIHRAADLSRILAILDHRAGEITVLPIHSFPGDPAKRVLIRARKGLRPGPLRLRHGIDLYVESGGDRTELMKSVAGEGAGLEW